MKISARNAIQGKVIDIKKGVVTAHVSVDVGAEKPIMSSITMESLEELGIEIGKTVYAVVKASDVMIGIEHHKR